ncbi:MAG: asparagine synthase (glutamine-hydrolyzing) [Bacteroidota bacterium]
MCGISGILFNLQASTLINKMVQAQTHRGPDVANTYCSKNNEHALGHNRLSIIDLSEHGNQPMFSPDKRYVMVFNGEVYNYRELKTALQHSYSFTSQTDSEVVLAAWIIWGPECLQKMIGMFSFAIWDTQQQTLFAARDRFGVKPFYYHLSDTSLYFASEIKTLWAAGIPKTKNDKVWANYFSHGSYGLPHETFWKGVQQLPAGYCLTYDAASGVHTRQWYSFTQRVQTLIDKQEDSITEQYEALLRESIRLRFRADVPVGFNLSGGVDSSTLLALVNQCYPNAPIEAYTFYTGDERYDELPWVQTMIQQTNNPLIACKFSVHDVPSMITAVSIAQDEPFGGIPTLAYANLFKEARNRGTKVLLDGQGMDEAWAGYDYYHNNNNQTIQGITQSPYAPHILEDEFRTLATPEQYPAPFSCPMMNLQFRDLFYTKIPRALRFNDRISMMFSTELREPFLDHRLVELAFSRPKEEKWHNGNTKWFLRNLVSKYLGDTISYAPKRALQTPQREWLSGALKEMVLAHLQTVDTSGYFKKGEVFKQYQTFCANPVQSVNIWQYVNFALLL